MAGMSTWATVPRTRVPPRAPWADRKTSGIRTRLAVEENAVLLLAVIEQAFAVVGGHRHDHPVEEPARPQALEQRPRSSSA